VAGLTVASLWMAFAFLSPTPGLCCIR